MKAALFLTAACLVASTSSVQAGKPLAPARKVQAVQSEAERGKSRARADYAQGKGAWHYWGYSNMPNGPDDPVRVRQDAEFVALLVEKGTVPVNANPGCIPAPEFAEFVAGYNAVADSLLQQRLGEDYMARLKDEVARRMQTAPGL